MTRSSIHHLFIHTSCPSIHYWSFSSRYHWPLPICFPNSSAPGRLHSFLQTSILSIDPHSDIYTVYISPSFPWLLIPVERLFMARLNTLHQRQSLQDADAKTQRHRFHSSLSNSNDLGESVPSMRREKRQSAGLRERLRGAGREKKKYKASRAIIMLREGNVVAQSKKPKEMKRWLTHSNWHPLQVQLFLGDMINFIGRCFISTMLPADGSYH